MPELLTFADGLFLGGSAFAAGSVMWAGWRVYCVLALD